MKIDFISPDIAGFQADIKPIIALLGGTPAMRAAGTAYLPMFDLEPKEMYDKRVSVSTLTPYFEETVRGMNGRLFYKPADKTQVAENLLPYLADFNLSGDDFSQVIESCSFEALAYRKSWLVVDYFDGGVDPINAAEEQQIGSRPFAYKVGGMQVMDVRYTQLKGLERITLFKYIHNVSEEINDFEIKITPEIVLFVDSLVKRYRQNDKGEWELSDERELKVKGKPIGSPPVVELEYARKPPLLNLAELNIKHWQSQSSQDNIVNVSRSPILFGSGFEFGDKTPISGMGFSIKSIDAKLTYVEHSGAAIKTGQDSLDKLEEQMSIAGAKLLTKTRMAFTDKQAKNEQIKEVSELQLYGMMLDDFASKVIALAGMWLGIEDAGTVGFSQNINAELSGDQGIADLINMVRDGYLSKQTMYETVVRREMIAGTQTWEQEQERIEIEQATSGLPEL